MKNYEKYDVYSLGIDICSRMYEKIFEKKCNCDGLECVDCPLDSLEKFYKWSQEEYIEPPKLSHDEYVILKNVDSEYKWIARHKNKKLYLFTDKPRKNYSFSLWTNEKYDSYFYHFSHLFQFIKWEDDEPYEIAKLIEDYEKEHGDGN